MADQVAISLQLPTSEVAVASTGIIGRKMPMDTIQALIKDACTGWTTPQASHNAAEAIMTTDTYPRSTPWKPLSEWGESTPGGCNQGLRYIAPRMATMLCFLATDPEASPEELEASLKLAVDKSFNMLDVDRDVSTNDTVILPGPAWKGKLDGSSRPPWTSYASNWPG